MLPSLRKQGQSRHPGATASLYRQRALTFAAMPTATSTRRSTASPKLGLWMCLALVIGNVIGTGVFLLPASLAQYGLNSILGWIMTSSGALLLAMVFARLARVFPKAGGPYVYPRLAFGEAAGFITAWGYLMSVWVGNAAIAIGTVASLAELLPVLKTTVGAPAITACVLIWLLTLLNWRGVRYAGTFQLVTTVLKLLPLLAIILLAAWVFATHDATVIKLEAQPLSLSAITASATLTLWALLGLESATVPGDRVTDPERTVPRATLLGTLFAAIIYIMTSTIVLLLIPGSQLAESNAPFADVMRLFWGNAAAETLALFTFISGLGTLNGWILVQGEMPRALAREGALPPIFARESRHGTPGVALLITSALVTPLVLMNYSASMVQIFTFFVLVSTSSFLMMYLFCSLAALKLGWQGKLGVAGRGLKALLCVATLAALYSVWTLYGAGTQPFWWSMGLLAAGLPLFWMMQRQPIKPAAAAEAASRSAL
jgi:basic amino acid/polyamine antiporter, APA family